MSGGPPTKAPQDFPPPSRRAVLWTQVITWSLLFLVMAWRMPEPDGEVPVCPSVLDSLINTEGIPKNGAGLVFGLIFFGILIHLSGWFMWIYKRWPKLSYFRASVAPIMGPQAKRLGLVVITAGILLGFLIQAGCSLS